MKLISVGTIAALAAPLVSLVAAHVSIISPCPRYSPVGENCPALPPGETLDTGDHAINGPISSVQLGGTMPLCRHTTPWPTPSAQWTAGQSVTIKFNPSAAIHSGGNCQFSISYDNGKTFAVIHEELKYCFLGSKPSSVTNTASVLQYTFNLPKDLPSSDKAVFAWSWINASGNREFYMNCADVSIKGGASQSYTGRQMVVANYPGYPTIPEFNGDYNTGMEHYTGAPNITVSPSGNSSAMAPPGGAASDSLTGSSSGTGYVASSAAVPSAASASSPGGYSGGVVSSAPAGAPAPPSTDSGAQTTAGSGTTPAGDYGAGSAPTFAPNAYSAAGEPTVASSAPSMAEYSAPTASAAAYARGSGAAGAY